LCKGLERIWAHAGGGPGTVILLGDYVDKGPQSRQVIEAVRSGLAQGWNSDGWKSVALKGNHDAMMVDGLRDPANRTSAWFEKGGRAALASYGGDAAAVPPADIAWLDQLPLMHLDRHRLYVHAGVEAGVALNRQTERTLLWKRYPPGDPSGFEHRHVVHGHDNFPDGPLLYPGRSNLDTLAWRTGRLVIGVFDDAKAGGPADFIEVKGPPAGAADPD
jgi:serine/threonine protein phosphatase 1